LLNDKGQQVDIPWVAHLHGAKSAIYNCLVRRGENNR